MQKLPSGTVTFLFTDIEGSTRLLHELGAERYAGALAAHRRVLRDTFARHDGVEVDTQGDAFFVAFPTAPGALAAAREAQEALQIPVRMGLHSGTPLLADEGYVGADVHRAARIAAAGHGRQLLVSASTAALLGPSTSVLLDLGEHRLKDLSAPERIYQAGGGAFPPLRSLNATNLPTQPTELIGREDELAQVSELIRSSRLVTLTGAGGSGKTRLALQAAAELVEEFADGVFWISLAQLTNAALVLPTIASTIGARDDLAQFVGEKRMLLLLDNLEHLLDSAPALGELVRSCPKLTLLVTGREPLRVGGEQQFEVLPLSEVEAVELFTQRARQVTPAFEPDRHVVEICRRLDGLPLAVELAAARTKLLSPQQILERLADRFGLLVTGPRDAPQRQRTLRATIEWSYDLLGDDERRLFARCAVFAGSFSVEAAEQVCGADLDALESLLEKSLLRRWASGRLGMLETIQEYAAEALEARADAAEVRAGFEDFFAQLLDREWERLLDPAEGSAAIDRLDADYDNVLSALASALDRGETERTALMARRLHTFWRLRDRLLEGGLWLDRAVAATNGLSGRTRAELLRAAGGNAGLVGRDVRHRELVREALVEYERASDEAGMASCLVALGRPEEALRIYRRLNHVLGMARALEWIGSSLLHRGRAAEALPFLEESLELEQRGAPADVTAGLLHDLGNAAVDLGDLSRARASFERSARLSLELRNRTGVAYCVAGLASVAAKAGEPETAARLWHAVEAFEAEQQVPLMPEERVRYERLLEGIPRDGGDALSLDEALELGLAMDSG